MGLFKSISKLFGGGGGGGGRSMAFDNLRVPTIEEQKIQLQELVQQGLISPEMAQYYLANPSAFNDIEEDPELRNAQLGSLQKLTEIADNEGMTATDRAKLEALTDEFRTTERGAREAITQNMAERGISGSGAELAQKIAAGQAASENAHKAAVQAAADAEMRQLEAIKSSGELGGTIRGQDYTVASDRAAAADAIEKFNAQNKQQVGLVNTATKNAAQEKNLGEKQRVADTNTSMKNYNTERNANLIQQDFENRYKKAAGIAGTEAQAAAAAEAEKNRNMQFWGSLIGAGGAVGAAAISDEDEKKDIEPSGPDLDEFMASLGSKRYKYKDATKPGTKPGQRFGVMAQDVEKTPVGATMVKESPEGTKVLDPDFGVVLASLARLYDKVSSKGGK